MKKTLLSVAFIAAGIFAFNVNAQEPCCTNSQECCQTAAPRKVQKGKIERPNPLANLNLTAEQQAAVKVLNEKKAQALKEKSEAKAKERKDRKNSRKEYLEEMKKILTPEQYTQYLENIAMTQPNRPKGEMKIKKGESKAHHKKASMKVKKGDTAPQAKAN